MHMQNNDCVLPIPVELRMVKVVTGYITGL